MLELIRNVRLQVRRRGAAPQSSIILTSLVAAALGAIGYWMLFSRLPGYDDEGYILISARQAWQHGGLYDEVYSQYGPAFYVLTDAVQALLGPLTHTSARWLTLGLWLGTALACTALVLRLTPSRVLPAFTAAATFLYLYFVPDEPFHPGTLIIFLLAASLHGMTSRMDPDVGRSAALIAGMTAAAVTLMKVNAGVFLIVAIGAWGAVHATSDGCGRVARLAFGPALFLLAAALMRELWGEGWVGIYLAIFGVGAITLGLALPGGSRVGVRQAAWFAGAGLGVAVVVVTIVLLRGTSPAGLLEGVVLEPLRHAGSYSYAVDWRPGTLIFAAASLALAMTHAWLRRRNSHEAADRLLIVLRSMQALALLVGIALLMEARVIGAIFSFIAPSIWIWVMPLRGAAESRAARTARGLLGTVLLLQFLQAYPIGGIQETWGTFLFMPLVALGLGEVRLWCASRPSGPRWVFRAWRCGAAILVAVALAKTGWTAWSVRETHASRIDLSLPGAERLRLPEGQRTAYRILALNAAVHADVLFSLPGLFSFNLFTDLPTPTGKNTTVWFTLLDDGEQQEIVAALADAPRACIIVEERLIDLMRQINVPVTGPLQEYIFRHYTPRFRLDGYAFMAPREQPLAPLQVAKLGALAPLREGDPDTELVFRLAGDGRPIARVDAATLTDDVATEVTTLNHGNASLSVTPIDRAGRPTGPSLAATWPLRVSGLAAVSIRFRRDGVRLGDANIFYLRGTGGERVGEARVSD